MEIKIATEKERSYWDEIVASSPNGTLFHTWDFLQIMQRHSIKRIFNNDRKSILYPLLTYDGQEIVGIFPLYYYKSSLFRIVSSPPFGVENHYLGPIMTRFEQLRSHRKQYINNEFIKSVNSFIHENLKPGYISIRTSPGYEDCRPFKWAGYDVEPFFTNIINLNIGVDTIWRGFSQRARRAIEGGEKTGVEVHIGSREDILRVHDLLKIRERISTTKEFLLDLFDTYHDKHLTLLIARKNNEVISGIVILLYNNKALLWIGHPRGRDLEYGTNELLTWRAMQWASNHGFEYFEMLGADDVSVFPFKSKFSLDLMPYYNIKWRSHLMDFWHHVRLKVNR